MMYYLKIKEIEAARSTRSPEYIEALYNNGVISGEIIIIRPSDLKQIWEKFYPERVGFITANRKDPACCGKRNHNTGSVHKTVTQHQYPSKLQMAKNLAGSVGRIAKAAVTGEKILRTEEEQQKCLDICKSNICGFFDAEKGRCIKCGCYTKLKTRLANEHCPLPVRLW